MIDTIVIGGGQAGLCSSYHLTRHGIDHVILERDRVASSWRRRWDSFTLVSPNGMNHLPGMECPGDADAFLERDDIVSWLEAYARSIDAPLRTGVEVRRVRTVEGGFEVATAEETLRCRNVVVATGGFSRPRVPALADGFDPAVTQLHSHEYRNPAQLPDGAVLVVGSGQSGVQITDDLRRTGRHVYLCVSGAVRMPRRYRGRDIFYWLRDAGRFERPVTDLDSPAERFDPNPQISGARGGYSVNLRRMGREGVTLLGRLEGADGTRIRLADDVEEKLAAADDFAAEIRAKLEEAVAAKGLDLPDPTDDEIVPDDWSPDATPRELDLAEHGITSVIWATGFNFDFSWIEDAELDDFGYPVQQRGVCSKRGLYFVGLPWLHSQKSGLLYGVGEDAGHVIDDIAARREDAKRAGLTSSPLSA